MSGERTDIAKLREHAERTRLLAGTMKKARVIELLRWMADECSDAANLLEQQDFAEAD